MTAVRRIRSIAAAICFATLAFCSAAIAPAEDELPVFRERRYDPYFTPDPRRGAPTLAEAIDSGLIPPFGWGWYGFGYPTAWGWGSWGGYGGLPLAGSPYRYPYPNGFNGRFWYPNGPSWPYGSLAPHLGPSHFGPLPPLGYSIYPFYPPQFPYASGIPIGDEAEPLGPYYW
jgi:hypothetical protein